MILILGGTAEGRQIANILEETGYQVLLTVVSEYGASLVRQVSPVEVMARELDEIALKELLLARRVRLVIDATHPYAAVITANAIKAAGESGIPYIRFERPGAAGNIRDERVYRVTGYEEAARIAAEIGQTVFLTIGSKNIKPFTDETRYSKRRVVARVLPAPGIVEQCICQGLSPKDIIALQGPFSKELNAAMLKEYKADVLVTKDSGKTGGTDTKIEAAFELGISVVLVERPETKDVQRINDIEKLVEWVQFHNPNK